MSGEWFDDIEVECQNEGCVGDGTAIWSGGAQKAGKPAPTQCYECYVANRDQQNETIFCPNCEEEYTYSAKYIVWYRRNVDEWETPKLCRWCTENPQYKMIHKRCDNVSCGKPFNYGPRWQKRIEEQGKSEPMLCEECREANKAQKPVRIDKCSACEAPYTYRAQHVISFKRRTGPWDENRDVCRLCFEDPQRAKRLKEKREKKEEKKKEEKKQRRFEDIVGYHLLESGTDEENAEWEGIVDEDTYEVPSYVQPYEILSEAELYARIVEMHRDGSSINAHDHIMYGTQGKGHGFDDLSFDEVLSQAGTIADDTVSSVIECRDSHTDYIVKYDTGRGVAVLICESENEITRWRVKTCYQPSQSSVAKKIREYRWVRMI